MTQPIRWLQDEIADRMLQKLDIVKLDVKDILIAPDFPGKHLASFAKRYPSATIHSLTEEGVTRFEMLRSKVASHWRALFRGNANPFLDYIEKGRLNLPDNSVDLVFSNLLLQDLTDPRHFLRECWRVLREGGLITFSYLGPDTGKELRALEPGLIQFKNLLSPWDMHDMGDALLGGGFSDPVMDMEFISLDYQSDALLLVDIEALKLLQMSASEVSKQGVLPPKMTLEVVYGHAWAIGKHLSKAQDNVAYIDANQIRRKTSSDSA
jgi:malonyl-CoA O-methyltransferase